MDHSLVTADLIFIAPTALSLKMFHNYKNLPFKNFITYTKLFPDVVFDQNYSFDMTYCILCGGESQVILL